MNDKRLVDPQEWINQNYDDVFELDDLLYEISMKIFDERIRRGLNQKEFANLLGVNQSMVSKLESGEYNPSIKQLYKISKNLI
ncbi:MAG: helix-turn-helix domain-containing protein [Clostridia bacterium]|jgi:DNA-binding XRE family transcriptional regulator|nr:helix-turn-helix domain-containing protein [Clostridia bacterium]